VEQASLKNDCKSTLPVDKPQISKMAPSLSVSPVSPRADQGEENSHGPFPIR
jgi:hypothetical protein